MGQKVPGACTYNLCTGGPYETHGAVATPRTCKQVHSRTPCGQPSGRLSRSSNKGTGYSFFGRSRILVEEKEEEQGQGTEREEIPHCRESLLRSKLPHAVSQSHRT